MARAIIWTEQAIQNLFDIFDYWNNRNKSTVYSEKLNGLIENTIDLLAIEPLIGLITDMEDIRIKLVRDFWIFYTYDADSIYIIQIKGTQQNPKNYFTDW